MTDECIFHNCLDLTAFVCLICLRYGGQRASGKLYCVLRVAYTYTHSYVARTGLHLAGWQYSPNLMLTFLYMAVNLVFLIVSDNLGSFCLFFLVVLVCCCCIRYVKCFLWMVVDFALFLTTLIDRVARFCRYSNIIYLFILYNF